jgi:hypothetical protein
MGSQEAAVGLREWDVGIIEGQRYSKTYHRPCVVAARVRELLVFRAWICPLQSSVVYCFCRFSVVGLRRSQEQ